MTSIETTTTRMPILMHNCVHPTKVHRWAAETNAMRSSVEVETRLVAHEMGNLRHVLSMHPDLRKTLPVGLSASRSLPALAWRWLQVPMDVNRPAFPLPAMVHGTLSRANSLLRPRFLLQALISPSPPKKPSSGRMLRFSLRLRSTSTSRMAHGNHC